MSRNSRLFIVTEGVQQQKHKRGKVFTTGAIYTYASRGHVYAHGPREKQAPRPVRRLPPYLIPLHLKPSDLSKSAQAERSHHRQSMAFMAGRGKGGFYYPA